MLHQAPTAKYLRILDRPPPKLHGIRIWRNSYIYRRCGLEDHDYDTALLTFTHAS